MFGTSLLKDVFDGLVIGVRACSASLSFLLVVRSINDRVVRWGKYRDVMPILKMTDAFVIPVKTALPDKLKRTAIDYAPLLSALIILIMGLGISALLSMLRSLISTV